jgi:hypothetical protein
MMDFGGIANGLGLKGYTVSVGKDECLDVGVSVRAWCLIKALRCWTYRTTIHRDHEPLSTTCHFIQLLYEIVGNLDQVSRLGIDGSTLYRDGTRLREWHDVDEWAYEEC